MAKYEDQSLEDLRTMAELKDIDFKKNIGKDALIKKLVEFDNSEIEEDDTPVKEGKTPKKTLKQKLKEMDIVKRVKISCNDPQFKGRNGVSLKVGNKYKMVGKFVPFDTAWHVQVPVLEALKNKRWRETKMKTTPDGMKIPVTRIRPAYSIEYLDDLTPDEIKKLAAEQAARGTFTEEQ